MTTWCTGGHTPAANVSLAVSAIFVFFFLHHRQPHETHVQWYMIKPLGHYHLQMVRTEWLHFKCNPSCCILPELNCNNPNASEAFPTPCRIWYVRLDHHLSAKTCVTDHKLPVRLSSHPSLDQAPSPEHRSPVPIYLSCSTEPMRALGNHCWSQRERWTSACTCFRISEGIQPELSPDLKSIARVILREVPSF